MRPADPASSGLLLPEGWGRLTAQQQLSARVLAPMSCLSQAWGPGTPPDTGQCVLGLRSPPDSPHPSAPAAAARCLCGAHSTQLHEDIDGHHRPKSGQGLLGTGQRTASCLLLPCQGRWDGQCSWGARLQLGSAHA